jgi:hypothetical protein
VTPVQHYYYRVTGMNALTQSVSPSAVVLAATPAGNPLSPPWSSQDIGALGGSGAAGFDGTTFTGIGSGADISGTSDAFRFIYQPLSGNGAIIARVVTQENTSAWAKAGVMIRETLNANSKHAMVVVTPGNGVALQYRTTTGGSSGNVNTGGPVAPYWVQLVRSGNTFSGYLSPDGVSWTLVGSVTVSMGTDVYIGLAVTAHNNSLLDTATFDNVSVFPRLQFTVPAAVTAGVPFNITVTVQDGFNHTATGYTGTVHFTASNGASASYTFTPADMGQHTFSGLVLTQAGIYTVTGTDTVNPSLTGSTTFTVTPAAPDHIALVLPSTISAGMPFALTVTVQDAYGNTVTGYGGTVHFTLTGPALAMADYTFTAADMGSHTFSNLVLNQTGTYMLTGTDTTDPMLTGSVMFTVM